MSYPEVYENSNLSGVELSRAKASYLVHSVALRQSVSGSVSDLARSLGFSSSLIQVQVYRLRMTRRVWEKLSPLMTEKERTAFLKEVEVPNE